MFDPLGSSPFADEPSANPPWPTTPHPPNSPIPNLRRSTPSPQPQPHTPDQPANPAGPYGREPQIYGQPDQGLISPQTNVATNGTKYELAQPYLRARITALDRNRRDILVRFDAQTNLANFTGSTYRNVSRSYVEFQQFHESIVHSNPQTIVPALPLAQTSAPTDEEDDRLVKIMLQRWLTRICEDPFLVRDEDVRAFVESDFGYQPTPRTRRRTSSGFSLMRKGVPDEDEELQRARFELTKLEGQFFDAAKAIDKLSKVRKALSVAHAEMGNKLINVATTETHLPLGNALRKLGRTWHSLSDLDQAQAISECVILGDTLGYQGLNARAAKDTLLQRTHVLEEYQAAVKATIAKRRHIERLKASANIRPDKVDEALEDMEEANKHEQILAHRVDGISQNLHRALQRHTRRVNDDATAALVEHARATLMYERQLLRELEALRPDVAGAAGAAPAARAAPRPQAVPPLEDDAPAPQPPRPAAPSTRSPALPPIPPLSPQSPGAGPSTPTTPASPHAALAAAPAAGPPLGGRFVAGTQSMFIHPTPRPPASPTLPPPPRDAGLGPLAQGGAGGTLRHSASAAGPLGPLAPNGQAQAQARGGADPLNVRPGSMSQSLRVQPSRPRLDAREAASKLANF